MPKLKEVLVQLLEPFKTSMMIFTPALLLVLGGFHFMSPTVLSQLIDLRKEEVNDTVVKEVTARIDTVVDKKLAGRNTGKTTATGALTKADQEVINKSIQKQVEEETKKATKDELENLAKTLKADLYKDISLSVIFAIASIFAAFAVKDILTEILKREEKKDLKDDIMEDLEKSIISLTDNSRTKLEESINKSIDESKQKLAWIEYELASLAFDVEAPERSKKYDRQNAEAFQEYAKSHLSKINKILMHLKDIDKHKDTDIEHLKAYENISFAAIMGKNPPDESSSGNTDLTLNYLVDEMVKLRLVRAGLILGEFKETDLYKDSKDLSEMVKILEKGISDRGNHLKTLSRDLAEINSLNEI